MPAHDFHRTRFLDGEACPRCGAVLTVTEEGFVKPDGRLSWTEVGRACQGRCTAAGQSQTATG